MDHHPFYPSPQMPGQILAYAEGMKQHHKEFGDVVGNTPRDLAPVVHEAQALKPLADEIHRLQIQLATRLDAYHKAAAPTWKHFAERIGYAREFADKHDHAGLATYLEGFKHHESNHAAKAAADATAPAASPSTRGTAT